MSIDVRSLMRGTGGAACAVGVAAALASLAGGFATYAPAAASGNNRGDVWLDTVTQTNQTGHEHDPHLPCNDINMWAASMNDASGPFTIQGWDPSGSGSSEIDYSATWHYDTAHGGSQIVAVIQTHVLIANAMSNGDQPQPQQGFHFKIDTEDPRGGTSSGDDKYKTFWIDCNSQETPAGSPGATTPTPGSTGGGSPTPGGGNGSPTPGTGSPTPTPSGGVGGLTTTPTPSGAMTPTPAGGVQGLSTTSPGAASGAAGAAVRTPSTGTALPLTLSGALFAFGLLLLGLARRVSKRTF